MFLFSFLTDSANNPKLNSSNSNISVRLEIVLLFAPVWEWIQILIGKIICTRRAPGGPSARVVYTSEPQGGSSGGLSERKALGLTPGLQFHRTWRAGTTHGNLRRCLAAIAEIKKYPKKYPKE